MNNATDALTTHNATIVTSNTTIITPEQPIGYGGVIHCPTKDGSVQKCTTGYCCANNSGCCINYMELWWFWLIWGLIITFSCFCAYHHHRIQHNSQNPTTAQRQQTTYVASCSYPGPPADGDKDQMGYCKLPKYGDQRQNTERSPPPPYRLNIGSFASILTDSWNSFWHQSNRNGLDQKEGQSDPYKENESRVDEITETRHNLTAP